MLPWNYRKEGREQVWVEADLTDSNSYKRSFEQVCAFNLIAQNYMPEGYIVSGIAPPVWAGDTIKGSRIAGGKEGAASKAAESLSSYGGARSRTTCGYVAAQCFASLMTGVMGDKSNQLSSWQRSFSDSVTALHVPIRKIWLSKILGAIWCDPIWDKTVCYRKDNSTFLVPKESLKHKRMQSSRWSS